MIDKFISPNWHVILIHYPIALLTTGVIIELISLVWFRDRFRAAGRWMITIGGLLSITAVFAGIYAFRDVMVAGPTVPSYKWHALLAANRWTAAEWTYLKWHIWMNALATLVFAGVITVWLSRGDEWRRKFYPLMLVLLIAGTVLMSIGAWHGGEMVYRHGMAVNPAVLAQPQAGASSEVPHGVGIDQERPDGHQQAATGWLQRVIPPLQAHIVLIGIVLALVLAAIGLTLHGWTRSITLPDTGTTGIGPLPPSAQILPTDTRIIAARFWLAAIIVLFLAVLAGVWSVIGVVSVEAIRKDLQMLRESDHLRLLVHVIAGVSFLIVAITLGLLVRFVRQHYTLKAVLIGILLLAAILQLWGGILMLFDSPEGPMTRFSTADEARPAATQPAREREPGLPAATQPSATAPGE